MSEPKDVMGFADQLLDELIQIQVDLHVRSPRTPKVVQCAIVTEGTKDLEREYLRLVLGLAVVRLADRAAHS